MRGGNAGIEEVVGYGVRPHNKKSSGVKGKTCKKRGHSVGGRLCNKLVVGKEVTILIKR